MSRAPIEDLLEQGKTALVALQYKEQIAIYRAASISLQSAITAAEHGDQSLLADWLRNYRQLLNEGYRDVIDSPLRLVVPSLLTGERMSPSDFPLSSSDGDTERRRAEYHEHESSDSLQQRAVAKSEVAKENPWKAMENAAKERLRHRMGRELSLKVSPQAKAEDVAETTQASHVEDVLASVKSFRDSAVAGLDAANITFSEQVESPIDELDDIDPPDYQTDGERQDCYEPLDGLGDGLDFCPTDRSIDDCKSEIDEEIACEMVAALPSAKASLNWREWLEPPVWASVGLHSIAIVVLSLMVIRHIQDPPATSIVSAAYEGDAILTQTPLEAMGELTDSFPSMEAMEELSPQHPLESISSSDLIGDDLGGLPTQSVGEVISASGGSAGLGVDSLSKVIQANAEMTGKNAGTGASKNLTGAEFFGVKATGNLFVYVVDCSPSMRRENAFEAAKLEIARSLQSMKPSQRYYIYFFAKEIERMESSVGVEEESPLYATKDNIVRTMEWLERTRIQRDGWPPNDVLTEAISLEPDGIFLLFDGDTRVDVAKHLGEVNRTSDILSPESPKAPIHVVHFFADQFAGNMRQVAVENGGTYRFIPKSSGGRRMPR